MLELEGKMKTLVSTNPEMPKPYESIDIDLNNEDIDVVMGAFIDFLHLPYEERVRIEYFDEQRPRTGRAGYVYKGERSPDGGSQQDNKHIFHMTKGLMDNFFTEMLLRNYPYETRNFLRLAYDVHQILAEAGKNKYQELEDDIPGITAMHFPRSGELTTHTRFLGYETGKSTLAAPHYDKSTGTIAVAESHGGLRLGFGDKDLTLVDRDQFDPVFFPSFGYHQLSEIMDTDVSRRAGWHDVVDTSERFSDEIARWALVNFINPANLYLDSTEEQTHTPIPWRGMGKLALRGDNASYLIAA